MSTDVSETNVYKKYVGIDYGTKRIGLAVSDDQGSMAFPKGIIQNTGLENVADEVSRVCNEVGAREVVLGESKNFKGEDNVVMKEVYEFINHLEARGLDVIFEPEIFSTMQAERLQGQRSDIDASAAAVILQSYLDRIKHQKSPQRSLEEIEDTKYIQKDE
ncbi:MAG: Holliday junction resolvase RuvX [Candidatus Pacebacteria bacterium]|nr:Holliday junction resolvase RuvX [Candidatus Paceibacterota bacterium]